MKEFITWKQFDDAIDKMVKHYKQNNYNCLAIYGPPRGGLVFAVALSHKLDLPLVTSLSDITGRILIVDDIVDTGVTMAKYIDEINHVIYTMHYHRQSNIVPDFYVNDKTDNWIVYPWETLDSDMIQDYLKEEINA